MTQSRRREPEPDHCAAAVRLEDALAAATGCEVCATPHPRGFQIVLDQAGATSLLRLHDNDIDDALNPA
jgi:hypothetical protein